MIPGDLPGPACPFGRNLYNGDWLQQVQPDYGRSNWRHTLPSGRHPLAMKSAGCWTGLPHRFQMIRRVISPNYVRNWGHSLMQASIWPATSASSIFFMTGSVACSSS